MACFTNIEGWYNPVWLHAGLGYRSPIIDEAEMPEMLTDTSPAGQQTVHRNGETATSELNFTSFTPGIHTITNFDAAIGLDTLSAEAIGSHASLQPHEFLYNGGTANGLSVNAAIVIQGVTPDQPSSAKFVLR